MGTVEAYRCEGSVDVNIPEVRHYKHPTDARLDNRLVDAIRAAEEAGQEHTARMLAYELASLYRETR